MCWHTNDMVVDGSYSGSSFDAALFFMRQCGLRLHDRIIYDTNRVGTVRNRWQDTWDFVFIFSEGKPTTFNAIKDRANIAAGKNNTHTKATYGGRDKQAQRGDNKKNYVIPPYGKRTGIWHYGIGGPERRRERFHPSPMPMRLVKDLIRAYSNPGDLVLDPFSGSATTAYAAQLLGRRAIGVEIHRPYIDVAIERRLCNQPLPQAEPPANAYVKDMRRRAVFEPQ